MNDSNFSVVILAAGQGTRMRSDRHKVLHPIADKPMLLHLLDTVEGLVEQMHRDVQDARAAAA